MSGKLRSEVMYNSISYGSCWNAGGFVDEARNKTGGWLLQIGSSAVLYGFLRFVSLLPMLQNRTIKSKSGSDVNNKDL